MTQLNQEILNQLKKDRELLIKVMTCLGVSERTVQKQLETNSPELTKIDVLNIIVEHLNMPLSKVVSSPRLLKLSSLLWK